MMGPLGSPPRDQQELAGHPRCSIGREVDHGRGDVIWDAHPSQGDGGLDLVQLVVNVKYLSVQKYAELDCSMRKLMIRNAQKFL